MINQFILRKLQCPFCESGLRLSVVLEGSLKQGIRYGELQCLCDSYPIIEGIVVLKKMLNKPNYSSARTAFLQKRYSKLISMVLEEPRLVRWIFLLVCLLYRYNRKKPFSFSVMIQLLKWANPGSRSWYQHVLMREKRATFMISVATLSLIKPSDLLVDLGCGAGHFLAAAHQNVNHKNMLGCDQSFGLLLLARIWKLKQNTSLICANIEENLPLKSSTVDFITLNDVFMYIYAKKRLIRNAMTCLMPKGVLSITHVHARNMNQPGQGLGVSIQEMKHLSQGYRLLMVTDSAIYMSMLLQNRITFEKQMKPNQEQEAKAFSFLLLKSEKTFQTIDVPDTLSKFILKANIDYTEDEYLKEHLE